MSVLIWVIRVLFFILVFAFASRNLTPVDVMGFLGYRWHAPLALVLLATLVLGVLLGIYGTVRMWWGFKSSSAKTAQPIPPQTNNPVRYRKPISSLGNDEGA